MIILLVGSHGAGVPLPSFGNNLTVDTANSRPAKKHTAPIRNLHSTKLVGRQPEKYNNSDGIMMATGTGNAKIALNTLNDNDWFILSYYFGFLQVVKVIPEG